MYPPKLYSGLTIQSRSAARRAAQDLVLIMIQPASNLIIIILTVVDEVCFAATDVNTGYKLKFQHRRRKQ